MLFILFDIEVVFLYPVAMKLDAFGVSPWWRRSSSSCCCWWRSCSSGGGERSNGSDAHQDRGRRPARPPAEGPAAPPRRARGRGPRARGRAAAAVHQVRGGPELGAQERALPARLRPRLLRDRDDHRDRLAAERPVALRRRGDPLLAAPGRPADPVRARLDQDGADHPPALRPDARAEVGDRDGRVLVERRHVQQLRGRPGRRQVPARRRLRARLPPSPGGAHLRDHEAPGPDHGRPRMGWRERYQARTARGGRTPERGLEARGLHVGRDRSRADRPARARGASATRR